MGKGGTRRSHWVLLLIWTANGLGLVLLAGVLLYFWGLRQPAVLAAPATPQPTQTAFVESATRGPYYLPSVTPRATFSPYPTPSPLPPLASLAVGHGPFVIGHSVEGRPLEVYRFGDGPTVRMIVAGIHGGNEWNTIALADQLIAYLYGHPEIVPENLFDTIHGGHFPVCQQDWEQPLPETVESLFPVLGDVDLVTGSPELARRHHARRRFVVDE